MKTCQVLGCSSRGLRNSNNCFRHLSHRRLLRPDGSPARLELTTANTTIRTDTSGTSAGHMNLTTGITLHQTAATATSIRTGWASGTVTFRGGGWTF